MLPDFRKPESDRDFDGPLHGKSGPIPIRRHRREHWNGYTRAVADSFAAMGYPMLDDQGRRASAAVVYLSPEVVMAVGPP